jgi:hypothetical protein
VLASSVPYCRDDLELCEPQYDRNVSQNSENELKFTAINDDTTGSPGFRLVR